MLQGLVDHMDCFTDINVGWPGRVHDTRVLHNSVLFTKGESGDLFHDRTVSVHGTRVPVVVLGDPAYPLRPWLMKSYINNGSLSPEQQEFNSRLSHARVIVVEHTFGHLKGRWRCLCSKLGVHVNDVPELVGACCVLHNICQLHGEGFDEQWLDESSQCDSPAISTITNRASDGDRIRTALTQYFQDN